LKRDSLDSLTHEDEFDSIGKAVQKLFDRQRVQAKLNFIVGQQLGGWRLCVANSGLVIDDQPFSVRGFEKTVDCAGDDDRSARFLRPSCDSSSVANRGNAGSSRIWSRLAACRPVSFKVEMQLTRPPLTKGGNCKIA